MKLRYAVNLFYLRDKCDCPIPTEPRSPTVLRIDDNTRKATQV